AHQAQRSAERDHQARAALAQRHPVEWLISARKSLPSLRATATLRLGRELIKLGWAGMFSRTVEYALRAVVYLGSQAPGARTTEQIADATKVPQAYLSKVIQALNRSGILRSQRGIGGGISLGRDADRLTIYDVVSAVEPWERIQSCPLGIASHG